MSESNTHHDALPLIEALLNGTIDDAGFARLQSILQDDDRALALYLSLANLHAALPGVVGQSPRLSLQITDSAGDALIQPHEMPYDQLMSLLAQVEAKGQDLDPMALAAERFPQQKAKAAASRQDWFNAGRYLLDQAKPYRQQAIMAVAAAVMLLATVLFLTWQRPSETSDPLTDATPTIEPKPQDAPATNSPVAFLLAQHDADWQPDFDYGTPEPGDAFYPGRRLTLTAGFAQITTARGAIAIIEAPATIDLTDSPNAIRLHTGKIVGICETDSSKGLLVRTPRMDVIDLGTRFGVAVSEQASLVRVIEGEVEVRSTRLLADDVPTRLVAGQAAAVDAGVDSVVRMEPASDRFAHQWQAIVNAPDLTGPIRYEPSIPSDLRVGASKDKDVRLFHERSGVVLDRGVQVNVLEPGRYIGDDLFKRKTLSNVTADSYLVHFDSDSPADEAVHRTVTIRFDRPILGVVTASAQLVSSHNELGLPGVRYGNQSDWAAVDTFTKRDGSGLDVSKTQASIGQDDAIQLSDDRQTLTLDLFTVAAIDQVRVLVQSKIQDQ